MDRGLFPADVTASCGAAQRRHRHGPIVGVRIMKPQLYDTRAVERFSAVKVWDG